MVYWLVFTVEYDQPIQLFTPVSSHLFVMWFKLQSFTNLPSKLIVTALLVDSGMHPLLSNRGSINSIPPSVWMLPRPSYGSTATVIFNWHGKEEVKFWCQYISTRIELRNQFNWQSLLGVKFPNLHDCIFVSQLKYFNWCEIFIIASRHCAAWAMIWALLVRRFYNRMYEQFPPHLLWS